MVFGFGRKQSGMTEPSQGRSWFKLTLYLSFDLNRTLLTPPRLTLQPHILPLSVIPINSTTPAFIQKAYPYSLRWVLFFCSLMGLIWALAMGVNNFRYTNFANESTKQKLFDVILGILYFVTAGIEFWALVASSLNKNFLAKPLLLLGPLGVLVAIASQAVAVIAHFTVKGDKINQCVLSYTTSVPVSVNGGTFVPSETQASTWCNDAWGRGTWTVFAWLIVVLLLALLFCSIAMSYARQVADPSLIRPRPTAQSRLQPQHQNQAYQMQPQQGGFYPPPPHNQAQAQEQGWMVPPYPGPPANSSTFNSQHPNDSTPSFEKNDYQPQAEWANTHYSPPPGSPPAASNPFTPTRPAREVIPNSEEDEAWERARTQGVTAHLTGQQGAGRQGGSGGMV